MSNFWLSDQDANTLDLDSTVNEISQGGFKRSFSIIPYMGSNGGRQKGFGFYNSRKFVVSRKERVEGTDTNFMNSRRNDFMSWFTRSATDTLYFNFRNGENTATYRTEIFTPNVGTLKADNFRVSGTVSFEITSINGVFDNITATTDSDAITANVEATISVTNDGIITCPITIKLTPSANASLFQVILGDGKGLRLGGSFNSGSLVSLDTKTGILSIGGTEQKLSQYLTNGSLFNIPSGTFNLYVLSDQAGTFATSFYDRLV